MTQEKQKNKPVPSFRHVADYLRRKIRRGEYRPGQMLPTMKEIASKFRLHRHTVETGVKLLQDENLVVSRPGGGTIVKESSPQMKNVLLLVPDIDSEHWQRVSKEIGALLQGAGWKLDIQQHYGSAWTFRKQVRKLVSGHYAGAMISAVSGLINGYMPLGALVRNGFPVTFIGRGLDNANCWRVDDGDFAGAYHGTKHLIECRFKRIGIIGCKLYNGEEFLQGCRKALREFSGDPMASGCAKDQKDALKLFKSWLKSDDIGLDSIFFHRVEHAQKAFDYLQSKRVQIGAQMGFITFDDTLFRRLTIPSPTAVRRYPERLGKRIANTFLAQISMPFEQRNFAKTVEAQISLDVGRSTGDRSSRKVYRAIDPVGGWREQGGLHGRFPY